MEGVELWDFALEVEAVPEGVVKEEEFAVVGQVEIGEGGEVDACGIAIDEIVIVAVEFGGWHVAESVINELVVGAAAV